MTLDLPRPPAWHADAACSGHDPKLWDVNEGLGPRTPQQREDERFAKAICKGCPVAIQCLEDALRYETGSHQVRATIRGGLTPKQRAARKAAA